MKLKELITKLLELQEDEARIQDEIEELRLGLDSVQTFKARVYDEIRDVIADMGAIEKPLSVNGYFVFYRTTLPNSDFIIEPLIEINDQD